MADPRDQQIDEEAIMMNLIAGGDEQIEGDDGSQFLRADYEEIMQGSSPPSLMSNKLLRKLILTRYIIHVY